MKNIKTMTMNNFKSFLFIIFIFFIGEFNAQKAKTETIVFQTSAQCGMCKERIEDVLNFVPGVQFAELNLKDMSLKIKYRAKKISAEELRICVSEIGYSADDVKANEEAMKKLPLCCQPGGHL